jgi:L-ascorbate metabolism protein UlaG (beta-lactamase superfamily)
MTMTRSRKAIVILLAACALLALVAWLLFQLPAFGGRAEGERLERMRRSPEFVAGRFENDPPQHTDSSLLKMIRLYSQGQVREPQFQIPVVPLAPAALQLPPSGGLRAIWFGHATVLFEIEGLRVMVDPVLSDVVSPVPVGPERFHPPPIELRQLAGVDAVLISHDHYDHLDMATVRHLAAQGTHFYAGLGVGAHLQRWGVPAAQVHEMDWWEKLTLRGVEIHCTPSRHYSGRKTMDNSTLWTSWAVKGAKHSVYFSGDSGYAGHFKDIRRRLGDMELTLIKVGAYGETWLDIHMDPESAVQAHLDLGGGTMLPVHWATFNLAYHAWDEPIVRAMAAAARHKVRLVTPRVGEVFDSAQAFQNTAWYRK